ncbi:Lrp/AsnC family transcriptional regulator [Pedobacter sp. MC2016-14]|uniref:Lrp/AsnC family transcriptional regulator n=1 Tax=Pedobacter sp. MC2016-14 TaxID=2897327 RepID=UPI001E314C1C|nr:Lrp/AsnC family transcriptional regulator [Pedobacter sp. MC2016-14]MCD0489406.1 Lrp/AsnC family transcriptional regulator [Pedobacter sp. MC2016-14]
MHLKLDEADINILNHLQINARISTAELSLLVKIPNYVVKSKIKRLENLGYIQGYVAVLNPNMVDKKFEALLFLKLSTNSNEFFETFRALIEEIPEIVQCDLMASPGDVLLRIVTKDIKEFGEVTLQKIYRYGGIESNTTHVVFKKMKGTYKIDLSRLLSQCIDRFYPKKN